MKKYYLIGVLIGYIALSSSIAQDDTVLFVKTTYEYVINNGQSTDEKYAVKQEMRNSKEELFREVHFSKETKQIDQILYYYYHRDNRIKLIETVNNREILTGYSTYKYKKGQLSLIEHYNYPTRDSVPKLVSKEKYKLKKGVLDTKVYNASNKLIKHSATVYENNKIKQITTTNNLSDTAFKTVEIITYNDKGIESKSTTYTSKSNNSVTYIDVNEYNSVGNISMIYTYKNDDKETPAYQTKFQFFPSGSVKDVQKTVGLYHYLEHTGYTLKKYNRNIYYRKPVSIK